MKSWLTCFLLSVSVSVFAQSGKEVLVINSTTEVVNTAWVNMLGSAGISYDYRSFQTLDTFSVLLNYETILYLDDDVEGGNSLTSLRRANLVNAMKNQKSLYIQSEYLSSYQTNEFFKELCDSAGGTFAWSGVTSGMFNDVTVLAPFNNQAVEVNTISNYWYGHTATFDNSIVKPFLVKDGTTFGFYIDPVNPGYGKVVTTTDRDFYTSQNVNAIRLIRNITHYLLTHSTLPVELSSFTGEISGGKVVLNWSTASEENNAGWEIQRQEVVSGTSTPLSDRNTNWETIGFVAGKGTTTEAQNYEFSSLVTRPSSPAVYRLKQLDLDGTVSYSQILTLDIAPTAFSLEKNYPNPFNPSTTIRYQLPAQVQVTLSVFDVSGRLISVLENGMKPAGFHQVEFNAAGLSSGIYYYQIKAGNEVKTGKMLLAK